jgi:hypothetical protein
LVSRPSNVDQLGDLGGDVRVGCDTPQEASVVDALASFGVVHADMPLTLANIWLAIQGAACSEGPARQCFPLNRRGLKIRGAATGRYGLAACAWSLAQVSLRPSVRLKTSRPGVESGSGQK